MQLNRLIAVFFISLLIAFPGWALEIKSSAPEEYVVKKGDTLWSIAGMYLDKPWNWPLLWQKNAQIKNPHLIYPGDRIVLTRDERGQPLLQLQRNAKKQITLSPKALRQLKNAEPIPTLPWSVIENHIENDLMMDKETYEAQPYLLGDHDGAVRFAHTDVILGKKGGFDTEEFHIVRLHGEVTDKNGKSLGYLVKSIAEARRVSTEMENEILVKISKANLEIKPGDRLIPKVTEPQDKMMELVAAQAQQGNVIASLQNRALLGKYDTVIIDIGAAQLDPGVVLGIYLQGPDIIDQQPLSYDDNSESIQTLFSESSRVKQPALKVGELVVFKTFSNASYGLITASTHVIRTGAIVARP